MRVLTIEVRVRIHSHRGRMTTFISGCPSLGVSELMSITYKNNVGRGLLRVMTPDSAT